MKFMFDFETNYGAVPHDYRVNSVLKLNIPQKSTIFAKIIELMTVNIDHYKGLIDRLGALRRYL